MTRPTRPLVFTPAAGDSMTLDELAEFVAEAIGKGFPGGTPVRAAGVLELNLAHGPRIARLAVVPEEVP